MSRFSTPCECGKGPPLVGLRFCGWSGLLGCCLLLAGRGAVASQSVLNLTPELAPASSSHASLLTGNPTAGRGDDDSGLLLVPRRRNPIQVAEQEGGHRIDMSAVAVLYPDIGEPYRSVFGEIIGGIQALATTPLTSYAIGPAVDVSDLNSQLRRNGTKVVIALGRQGLKAAAGLDHSMAVVAGGVISVPESDSQHLVGVSLTPDPGLLFSHLKGLLPEARRVIVIYDPQNSGWLINLAREAARAQGLELEAHEAHDLASAAHLYEAAFAAADGRHDAIWLPQDATTVDENTIMPLVLREAWNRSVPVFSSSLLHVRKGVLFALYPDNVELGRTLGHDAEAALGGEGRHGMLPLRAVLMAVNLRTASHIGLNIGYQQQRSFDMVFPEP